jgi:hypothetical protein
MILFKFHLTNPWVKDGFKSLWSKTWKISKNKNFEIDINFYFRDFFTIEIDFSPIGKDHGGINIEVSLLGFTVNFNFYDSRHWDYDNICWENPENNT